MSIRDTYYTNPYMDQWSKLYPNTPFPTPQQYPSMYPDGATTRKAIDYVDPLFPNCNAKTCPRGLIDYRCQYENGCYFKLAELAFDMLGTFIIVSLVIALLGKLCSLAYNFFTGIFFVTRIVSCMTRCLECLSFGMMSHDMVVEVEAVTERKLTEQQKRIERKLAEIDVEVNFQALDRFQVKKLGDLLEDYQVVSQQRKSQIEQNN